MLKKYALLAALMLVIGPASARADWLFTPNLGTTFGADASGNEHFTYGVGIGYMGAGAFGWEADLSYTPEFFEAGDGDFDPVDNSNVTTAMFNVLAGIPIGGQTGGGFRPYFTGGIGLLQREIETADQLFNVDSNEWGFNLGFGAMGFATDHVGLRGDLRYLSTFSDSSSLDSIGFDGGFNYWRGSIGLVIR